MPLARELVTCLFIIYWGRKSTTEPLIARYCFGLSKLDTDEKWDVAPSSSGNRTPLQSALNIDPPLVIFPAQASRVIRLALCCFPCEASVLAPLSSRASSCPNADSLLPPLLGSLYFPPKRARVDQRINTTCMIIMPQPCESFRSESKGSASFGRRKWSVLAAVNVYKPGVALAWRAG
jgi:hypothetical protein